MQAVGAPASSETALRTSPVSVRAVLDRVEGGEVASEEDAHVLIEVPNSDLDDILAVSRLLRARHKGTTVTYSPKVFLPITNLCRDFCSYCTFRKDPNDAAAWTMLPEEIRSWSRRGRDLGCIEALMCLGDKPELVFKPYRKTLEVLGQRSTIDYVRQACEIALEEGLLPHTNAGIMSPAEMADLKPVNVSMGLMLESVSARLRDRGGPHYHAPDKDPQVRLRMIGEAGALKIPFTTGILIGIGETRRERVASLVAIQDAHRRYGHIQEIILQNFRAKPTIPMATTPEPDTLEMARTIAVCRILMPEMNIQAPPNLSPYDHRLLLNAGLNDWGGISPLTRDYVNPEAPWPHVATLAETCAREGFTLRPRLPVYPEYLARPGFLDPSLQAHVKDSATPRGVSQC
jgi:7,8-didemethyl-8-hydroxy-5-deazariboflavin synthase CofG subunit